MESFPAIWQVKAAAEYDWIRSVFGDLISHDVYDGQHKVVRDNCFVIDNYLHTRPVDYYRSFSGKNAFLIHLSDETYEGGYNVYQYFRGVFRNYWSSIFHPARVLTLPLGYTRLPLSTVELLTAEKRKYTWSFLGGASKASRPDMLRALRSITPQFVYVTDDSCHPRSKLSRAEYQELLLQSVFVPCPMGNVNLECWRIYEALECGALPILERRATLDYFGDMLGRQPLPSFRRWEDARIFIEQIACDPLRLEDLRTRCLAWWNQCKAVQYERIRKFIADSPEHASVPSVSWRYQLPGWQGVELLRHHSLGAMRRRVSLQAHRLIHQRRLRFTKGR
jgi:hypothetical protein